MKFISASSVAAARRLVPIAASLALALLALPRASAQPNPYPATGTSTVVIGGSGITDIGAEIQSALNNAQPGTHILIRAKTGAYTGGTYTFNRNGTLTEPIVIRPEDDAVTIDLATWNIQGSRLVFSGLYFTKAKIRLGDGGAASFCRITRCHFRKAIDRTIRLYAATDTRIDHCDIGGSDGFEISGDPKSFVWLESESVGNGSCERVLVDHNYIHDFPDLLATASVHDFIGLSSSNDGAADANPELIIEHNLVSNIRITDDGELIGAKCAGIKFRFNTVIKTFTECYINGPRQSAGNFELRSNWFEDMGGTTVMLRSDNGLAIGNRFVGESLHLSAGDVYWNGPDPNGKYPAARNCRVIGNYFTPFAGATGHIIVGSEKFTKPNLGSTCGGVDVPALNNNLYQNTREDGNQAHTFFSGTLWTDCTSPTHSGTTFNADNEPYVAAVQLTSAQVGLTPTTDPLSPGVSPILVGHWQLNEVSGTTAADASGNGNNGTLQNGPGWTPGQIGKGLNFDGANDVVNAGSGVTLDNLRAISVAAWIKADAMGGNDKGRIVNKGAGNGPSAGWIFFVDGTRGLNFVVDYSTTNLARPSASDAIGSTFGVWKHVVATWSGSATATQVKIYVDGAEVSYGTPTNGVGSRIDDDPSTFYIGNSSSVDRGFDGVIDDVRVYNGVLSAGEIQAIYQAGLLPAPTSLAATVASAPNNINQINLSWVDNANNETGYKIERKKGSSGTYAQIGTAAANVTSYSDTTAGAGTQYYYRVRAYNGTGDSAYSNEANATTAEVTSGRVAHWKLNETSGLNASDETANNNDGALQASPATPAWAAGKIGNGLNFDGADDRVNAGSGASLDNLGAMTLSAWIKPDTLGGNGKGRIVEKTTSVAPSQGWLFNVDGTNQLNFIVDYATTNLQRSTANGTIAMGEWQHVLVTWTGSATALNNIKFYKNGAETGYGTTTNGAGAREPDGAANVTMGNNSSGIRGFDGLLDDVRVYNRVLTAAEIAAIHRAGL